MSVTIQEITPTADSLGKIGTASKRWGEGHFVSLKQNSLAVPTLPATATGTEVLYDDGVYRAITADLDAHASSHVGGGADEIRAATNALNGLATAAQITALEAATTHGASTANPHSVTKTQVGLGSVENTALSTWAGSANITTLGTIASGTWNGGAIGIAYGGTGQATAQAAIDALTAVSGATDEHVLTKDTASGNAIWKAAAGGGSGDVVGPASATDSNLVSFDTTTGKLIKDSGVSSSSFATAAQGALADTATQPGDAVSSLTNDAGYTDDQTGAEIKAAYEGELDTNAFTDAEKTLLGNQSGVNTGDQDLSGYVLTTAIDTLAELNAIITDATLIDTGDSRLSDARTPTAHAHEGTAILSTGEVGGTKFLREDGDGTSSWQAIAGGGDALTANPLSQFAATTSLQLAGVISDETGSGALVFATSPTLVTPALGTPASGVLTNCTGTASGLTAGNVTTNANLTGHVTSTGNAAVLGSFTVAQLSAALSDATLSGNNTGDEADASDVAKGIIEIATQTEVDTGTDTVRAVTPATLEGSAIRGEVTANTAKVSNATHTGDVTGATALTIANDAVTLAKMADMATASFIGRSTAGTGDPEVLTSTQARTILNVADGATANSADATLLSRANHTGTQTAATISDFDTEVSNNASVAANTAKLTADATNIAAAIVGVAGKTTPVDADTLALIDSEASNALKELSGTNLKAYLKTYFDTLYADEWIAIAFSDETTEHTAGTAKVTFHMPNYATTLLDVLVGVTGAPVGSTETYDINEAGETVLSVKVTIDAGEYTSATAATAPTISDAALAANAKMTLDIDSVGATTAATGGKLYLRVRRA